MTSLRHSLNGKSNYSSQFFPQLENVEAVNLSLELTLGGWKRETTGRSCPGDHVWAGSSCSHSCFWLSPSGKVNIHHSLSLPQFQEALKSPEARWNPGKEQRHITQKPLSQAARFYRKNTITANKKFRDFLMVLLGHPDIFLFLWLLLCFYSLSFSGGVFHPLLFLVV